jgi:hypothetical protein
VGHALVLQALNDQFGRGTRLLMHEAKPSGVTFLVSSRQRTFATLRARGEDGGHDSS